MTITATHHTGYLKHVCSTADELRKTIALAIRRINQSGVQFDAIACRGTSGLAVAPIISYKLNKQLIVVRKPKTDETSHTISTVEGLPTKKIKYIIIDDLVASGSTLRAIINGINEVDRKIFHSFEGLYLYNSYNTELLNREMVNQHYDI